MNDHQDRPDIRLRRRITRLRADLGLVPVPAHVGTELREIAPRVSEQVVRVVRRDPTHLALSPDAQVLLLSTVGRAVDEFARLVEDRPPRAPAVEAMLIEIVHVEGQLEPCRAAVHAAFQTLREVTRALWPQLPHARSFSAQLDLALSRYAGRLCARTMAAHRVAAAVPTDRRRRDGEAHLDGLLSLVEHRWGAHPVQLYLSVTTLGAVDIRSRRDPDHRDTARPIRIITTDHVVIITEDPTPPRPISAAQPHIVVCVGPTPVSGIPLAHDTALLLLRLIRAGVAAPPSPVLIEVPEFGFLHPSPSEASVQKITDLLLPLGGHGTHRRSALARTLQLCLRTATTAQGLAKQLAMHPQTVHNHLTILRTLYNPNLDFAEDNLSMQAALNLVLPLWELEAGGRPHPSAQNGKKLPGNRSATETFDLP
ncbi:hypothetical protein GCM10023350_50220 [Nocardioides endophyticus]|uniref:PucR family transcriptional regulator n=1 Tax=Nocardioides endophyticus TaxID=1353775 RepID=A0ABP8ZK41_9ACTN